jgi:hypothetical protein
VIGIPALVRISYGTRHLLFAALALLPLMSLAQLAKAQAPAVEARIASVSGTALLSNGAGPPAIAKRGDVLVPGEEIDTRNGGHLTIELTDGSLVVVRPDSRILLKDFHAANTLRELFEVLLGRVRIKINHFGGKPNPYRINSPTASIAVRGTEFSVAVNGVGDTQVVVYDGLVEVTSLSNPEEKVLVHPGQGVIVRPNQPVHFFTFAPGGEIGGLESNEDTGDIQGRNTDAEGDAQVLGNADSPRNSAGIYDRFVENAVATAHGPLYLRFTAYPDSFLDGLENPAYATEFSAPAARIFLLPSFRGSQGVGVTANAFFSNPGQSIDYSLSPQGSFFTPLPDHRTAMGGGFAAFRSGVQSFTTDDAATLSGSFFPPDTNGMRASSNSTTNSFFSGSLAVAHAFEEEKKTSVGLGWDYVKGLGSILNSITQQDSLGNISAERLDSRSSLVENHIKAGLSHEFSGQRKLGIYYSYGFVSANFDNISHTLNDQPQSLDSTRSDGHSSEAGIRFRGIITRKLFYGAQASWFLLSLNDRLNLASIVNSNERDRTTGSSFAVGFGYVFHPRVVFSLDLEGGFSNTTTMRKERATGNLLERNEQTSPFFAVHTAVQASVWRGLFVTASVLTLRQNFSRDLTLYPDSLGRLLTSDGTFAPNGFTSTSSTSNYSEFGVGWRFNSAFLAEYIFSTDYGKRRPSHVFLLRYNFRKRSEF